MKTTIDKRTAEDALIGLHPDMPNDAYHAGPGYSASDLIAMADGFDYWRWKKDQPREASDAMILGSATHLLLESRLKGDVLLFQSGIAVLPKVSTRSKEGKAEFEEFTKANEGKLLLSTEDLDLAQKMVDAVLSEPEAAGYLQGGLCEPSIFVRDPETDVLRKIRPDYLRPDDGLLINFKTVRPDVSFERQAAIMAYDWASSYYCDTSRIYYGRSFDEIHISVTSEREGPCRVSIDTIEDEDLEIAKAQWRGLLSRIPECERADHWPKPPVRIKTARIPNFSRRTNPYA